MSTSHLTGRQSDELLKSVLDYLASNSYHQALEALKGEAHQSEYVHDPNSKTAGLLEKKWTSVIRLQKKIMDLEARNSQLTEELNAVKANPSAAAASTRISPDWIPRNPPRHSLTGHKASITRVTFHPIYNTLVTASEDATLKVWDWESGEFERTVKGHTKAVMDCDFDAKGELLASCSSDLTIKIWAVSDDYKNTKTLYGHDHSVSSVKFMPSGDHLVSASRDKTVRMWEVSNGYCVRTFQAHLEWVRAVEPSSDGRHIVTASSDQTARIWDVTNGETKQELRGHDNVIEAAVFAPTACFPAIRELAGITAPKGSAEATMSIFVATASRDKTVKLWDGISGQCLRTFSGHDNWVRSLAFHPSGLYLLSASDDKTLRVWDLKTGRCAKTIEAHSHFVTCLAWGRTVVQSNSGQASSQNGSTVAGQQANGNTTKRVNVIATGSVDQTVKIWLP